MIETLKFPVSRIKIHEPELDLQQAYDAIVGVVGANAGLVVTHRISADGLKFSASWFGDAGCFVEADSVVLLLAKVRRVMNGNA